MSKRLRKRMRVITVNVPESYLEVIRKLINVDNGIYPSRSELLRVAVREKLLQDLKMMKRIVWKSRNGNIQSAEDLRDKINGTETAVCVPKSNKEFKTYKIVRRLEY